MKRSIVVLVLAMMITMTGIAWGATTHDGPSHHPTPRSCTVQALRPFSANVWRLNKWERGIPPKPVLKAYERRLSCAPPSHRKAMKATWHRDQRAYFAHRHKEEFRQRWTPEYGCTSMGGCKYWAIPVYIVECESHGDYSAANPTSTAYGAYQMLDSTYASYCHSCDWSITDQDRSARELYEDSGSSPWVCG